MVPDELIPRCPHCGAEMFPWVRGYGNFLQGEYYGAAEPPVRCGESHLSGLTEPPHFVY